MGRSRTLIQSRRILRDNTPLVFKRWSNKGWAVLATFHKVVLIGTLCCSYNMLAQTPQTGLPHVDSASMKLELEEVEAVGESPSELESASLKPLISITSQDVIDAGHSTPEEMLEHIPGLDIRQRGNHGTQADLTIQGGSFDQSMVLLNGINLSDPQTGHFHLNLPLDLSAVSQAKVLAGSAARRFGTQAFTGAVNFVTSPPDTNGIRAGVELGQHRFYKAFLNAHVSGKSLSTMASISTSGSDGYRENTDFSANHFFLHTTAGIKEVNAHLLLGLNTRKFGANSFYSPRFQQQYEETATGFAALKFILRKAHSSFTLNTYYRRNKDYFLLDRSNPEFFQNDHLTQVGGSDLIGRFSSRAGVTQTGILLRRETILSTSLGEPLSPPDSVVIKAGIAYSHSHSRSKFNLSLNHTYEGRWFSLSGGLLVHFNSDLGSEPTLMPGLDVRFKLSRQMDLFASLNRSMRMPTFTDLFYQGPTNIGNPNLLPEKAITAELGIHRKGAHFQSTLSSFYRQGRDLIDWVWMEDEKWHTKNLTEIDAAGGSLSLQYDPRSPAYQAVSLEGLTFSYTFTYLTKVSEELISRYLLDNLKHKVSMGSQLSILRNFSLFIGFSFQDRNGSFLKYDSDSGLSQEQAYEPYLLMDVKLTYSFKRFHIYVKSNNLLNASYYDIGNVIQPGRWSMAGIEFR
jgi:vitamin B12 transporter